MKPPGQFRSAGLALFLLAAARLASADRIELVWPTPNPAWAEGRPIGAFLQHAGSGEPESGGFGGVRNNGTQFHEGLDLKCIARDRRGEPKDDVMAAMAGVVRHVSASAGDSSYGRYVVLEHPGMTPAIFTLYAHLARIAPGLHSGDRVTAGQVLGTMGHSSGGYVIPRDRAHLHFEMGVMVTQSFPAWYAMKKFGSPNDHGLWNGMNLMGFDPLDFFNQWRARKVNSVQDYLAQLPVAVRLRFATRRVPDYVLRYPSLLTRPLPAAVAGWEIAFDWTGLPLAWKPLAEMEAVGLAPNQPRVVDVDQALIRRYRSKTLVVPRRGGWVAGKDLETVLQQLFGAR
jgi:murein DD-endopeptidase MepM/ murein hydrolase activator NlpD